MSLSIAREILSISDDLGRRVGVLINRDGRVEEVICGTREILYLPDLGRYRLDVGRLRRLRLVFSDLSARHEFATIPSDILTDLEKLRLDLVAALREHSGRISLAVAHLVPSRGGQEPEISSELFHDIAKCTIRPDEFLPSLEAQIQSSRPVRRAGVNRAALIGVYATSAHEAQVSMAELRELARTAGVEVVDEIVQRRPPDPRTLLGKGKLEEVILRCLRQEVELLVFDGELRPNQWRSITNSTELRVIDRSMLILDIFAQRASSHEGRLQVELAQLKYNLPRLVEKDVGMSRLTGGIGGRGPGETKLEVSRRRTRDRIRHLERQVERIAGQRELRRGRRKGREIPLIALLGYTNAGKSTLFRRLTQANVLIEDKLFATLEPFQRRLVLPPHHPREYGLPVILSDTVGFIRDLPAELVQAFRATLEELSSASVFVHVVDVSDPRFSAKMTAVREVVRSLGLGDLEEIVVFNKADRVPDDIQSSIAHDYPDAIFISAELGDGVSGLREVMSSFFVDDRFNSTAGTVEASPDEME